VADLPQSAASLTRRAIKAAGEGETGDARQLLAEALSVNPEYEPAWMWFARVAETDGERRFCLDRAIEANPASGAARALRRLEGVEPQIPPEVEDVIDPEIPADILQQPAARRRRRGLWIAGAVTAVVAVVAGVLVLVRDDESPVYLAFVAGLEGADTRVVTQMQQGIELYLDRINDDGGVDGHPVRLLTFDDEDDADMARRRAEEIVDDDRVLAVIGHETSGASLAAAPVYEAAGVPVVTPTATADELTTESPWSFSTVFTNSRQGRFIATYLLDVLSERSITVVQGNDDYSSTLGAGVVAGFTAPGQVAGTVTMDTDDPPTPTQVDAAVDQVAATAGTGTIVLTLPEVTAIEIVPELRRAGVDNRIIGGDAVGTDAFFAALDKMSADETDPELFTREVYATAPMITDSLSGDAVRWLLSFIDTHGGRPTWEAATSYDAAVALAHALDAEGMTFDRSSVDDDRERIRDALAALDSPDASLHGLVGPIWFSATGSSAVPVIIGRGSGDRFVSAPEQLLRFAATDAATTQEEIAEGQVVEADGQYYQRKRVVTIGINVNEVSELDSQAQTFHADFFLWLNYTGDDTVTDLSFPNATDPNLSLGDPVRTTLEDGVSYQLYRVRGTFQTELDFRDFPFDDQTLPISVQNRSLPASDVVYAGDPEILAQSQDERLSSGVEGGESINALNDWKTTQLLYVQDSTGTDAALGDPELGGGQTGLVYAEFLTDITIERDVGSFLIKNLLPLLLLAAVTYTSLFFSHSQTGARVSFGITGILTGAVLLSEVTSSLPSIGYTVAIQWAYYAFILLSVCCVLVGLIGDRLFAKRRLAAIRRLDLVSRISYPLACLAIVGVYVVAFG